jgi:serine/threonine-protein kinase
VTPNEYAQVKDVFAQAIVLPEVKRADFARQNCDDQLVLREVLSLLAHHHDGTIIDPQKIVPNSQPSVVDPPRRVDPYLVLRDVWEDNRQILRRRLIIIAVVMSVLITFSLVRLLTYHYAVVGYGVRITALAISLGCAWVLHRKRDLTLSQIRIAEYVVMANIGLLAIVIFVRLMLATALRQDAATLISINNWNYFTWTLIILVYGVFMPNRWQRAAAILLPVAALPAALHLVVGWFDPQVALLLAQDDFGKPFPTPFLAAAIAIYAAHLIHGATVSTFQARRIAQYHIQRLIGEGAMGKVFEAEHLLLRRDCAIKLIRPEYCADNHALQRFEREVRATAQLTHPHTIEVFDYGQTKEGIFFYVMELLPGMNLREIVNTSGPLPPARAVHFLIEVCEALEEAHGKGLIHRDVKPTNIFASQRGGIYDFTKLLDFGVVREMKVDPSLSMTSNMVAGTPAFMSPEQITAPANIDARADIYGVGAVAYYLLTGRPAFVGESPLQIMLAQVNQTPDDPSTHRSAIPADLHAVIMRCLSKNVDQRIATAKQLKRELQQCQCAGGWTQDDAVAWWNEQGRR